jgi:hypothetical protein
MSITESTLMSECSPGEVASGEHAPALPSKAARCLLPYLVFAICTSLYFLPYMQLVLHGSNEGILVDGAVRTVQGQLLGRDFFEVVGPGTFYWLALFFKLFGVTFLASRICLFVSSLGTALSIYFLSRKVCPTYQLLPCSLIFATYFATLWPEISHHVDSNFFALLAIVCMVLWQDRRKSWLLIAAGAFTGATALILQQKGIFLLLALLVWLWMQHRQRATPLMARVVGACVGVVTIMLTYFWSRGALGDLVYANVVWPSHNYSSSFSAPYAFLISEYFKHWVVPMQGFNWTVGIAAVLFLPFLFVTALPVLVACLGARHSIRNVRPEIALYWLAGAAIWISEIHRKDIAHLVFGSPLLIVLAVYYLQDWRAKGARLALQSLTIASACLCCASLFIALVAYPVTTRVGRIHLSARDPVLTAIQEKVPLGAEIFIYPYAPMYYFLSGTNNPARYSTFCFDFKVGSSSQLEEVTQNLEQHQVKYVLWDKKVGRKICASLSPEVHVKRFGIEPYLEAHYKPIWADGETQLMERETEYQPR